MLKYFLGIFTPFLTSVSSSKFLLIATPSTLTHRFLLMPCQMIQMCLLDLTRSFRYVSTYIWKVIKIIYVWYSRVYVFTGRFTWVIDDAWIANWGINLGTSFVCFFVTFWISWIYFTIRKYLDFYEWIIYSMQVQEIICVEDGEVKTVEHIRGKGKNVVGLSLTWKCNSIKLC